jgi:hypothetical protein
MRTLCASLITVALLAGSAIGVAAQQAEPTTTEELLSGMVTEEVEPGVYRVINDGVRDLTSKNNRHIVAGHDDGIWLLRKNRFFRLGGADTHAWPSEGIPQSPGAVSPGFEVSPDGTIWVIDSDGRQGTGDLLSSEGDGWTAPQSPPRGFTAFEVAPDGTVWASWADGDARPQVGHLGPTGWQPLDLVQPLDLARQKDPDAPPQARRLFVTDSGDVYAASAPTRGIQRHEDGVWHSLTGVALSSDVGPDGTVWHFGPLAKTTGAFEPGLELPDDGFYDWGPVRFAGGAWDWWTQDDLPEGGLGVGLDDQFAVAPDGSLWASRWQGGKAPKGVGWDIPLDDGSAACDGVSRFDGETIDHFLPGRCITMDIAADGSVWLLAGDKEGRGLYVITPEAVAAAE